MLQSPTEYAPWSRTVGACLRNGFSDDIEEFGSTNAMSKIGRAEFGLRKAKILFGTIVLQRILVTTITVNSFGRVGILSLVASAIVVLLFLALTVNRARIAGITAGAILLLGAILDFIGVAVVEHYRYNAEIKLMYFVSGLVQLVCGALLLLDRDIRAFCRQRHIKPV